MAATTAGLEVATLLVVHHSPGTALPAMLDAALSGARSDWLDRIRVAVVSALEVTSADVLGAAGYLLATPANLGYMSGALKDFFERIYYPCLEATEGKPVALYVKGGLDGQGAKTSVERILTGLKWKG